MGDVDKRVWYQS